MVGGITLREKGRGRGGDQDKWRQGEILGGVMPRVGRPGG